jgi:hypothetical protein
LVGHPARSAGLERFLDHVVASGEAWICRRLDIARHWAARFPAGSEERAALPLRVARSSA